MREEAEAWHDAESVDGRRRCVLRAVGRACARARSGGLMELMLDVPVVRFAGRPEVSIVVPLQDCKSCILELRPFSM